MLVIQLNMGGQLICMDTYPTATRNKSCYFIKKTPGPLPNIKDDFSFKKNLIYGDLAAQPLENLVCFIENVRHCY